MLPGQPIGIALVPGSLAGGSPAKGDDRFDRINNGDKQYISNITLRVSSFLAGRERLDMDGESKVDFFLKSARRATVLINVWSADEGVFYLRSEELRVDGARDGRFTLDDVPSHSELICKITVVDQDEASNPVYVSIDW